MITTAKKAGKGRKVPFAVEVAGLEFIAIPCAKCGKAMFRRPCPCRLRKHRACAQCIKCGYIMGLRSK
jgi:predicted RNA-binding Zn-ribbon protein involved in translation (DUF1610 family)